MTSYFFISSILKKRATENLTQLASRTSGQVDAILTEMDRIALYVVSNPLIKEVFSAIEKPENVANFFDSNTDKSRKVINTLISINVPNETSTMRTSLYDIQGNYISMGIPDSSGSITARTKSAAYLKWYEGMTAKNEKLLFPPHQDYWSDDKDALLVSLTREIIDPVTYASYGIVEVQLPYKKLDDLLKPIGSLKMHTYLITEGNTVIYPAESSREGLAPDFLQIINDKNTTGHIRLRNPGTGRVELAAFYKSRYSGWILVQSEEESHLLSPVRLTGILILITGLCLMIVTSICIYILTNRLTKPLKILRNSVKEVSLDNFSLDISNSNNDNEVTELNKAFNAMFLRLKESMEELIQARSHEMKAHMIALQSQMDPHFLFNMLSVISASSRETGVSVITDICQKLSDMLRYIASYQDDFVPIRAEIAHTVSYLTLMKTRYENQFDYKINICKDVYDLKVDIPKLTLQPLVENCFKHGFKHVLPPWYINIEAGCQGNIWFIQVSDNGAGIDADKVREIFNRVDEFYKNPSTSIKDLKLGGLGLINTLARLKLIYRDDMILSIQSSNEAGTKIKIGGVVK